ncbi:MAG: hypothetical protein IJY39_06945 [Clostridia bacterium]|nr:hypothetical protein [Clostridia bacterium]
MNDLSDNKSAVKDFAAADKAFFKMILPPILGIFICMLGLASSTWALYSESITASATLQSTCFVVTSLEVKDEEGYPVPDLSALASGTYTVTVETNATDNTIGFCSVRLGNLVINDTLPPQGGSFELILQGNMSGELTATAFWGNALNTLGEGERALCLIDADGCVYLGDDAEKVLSAADGAEE